MVDPAKASNESASELIREAGAPDSELTVEQLDRLDRCVMKMQQAWDRFDFARPKLLERYLKGELRIHLQFRVHFREFDSQSY